MKKNQAVAMMLNQHKSAESDVDLSSDEDMMTMTLRTPPPTVMMKF